MKLEKQPTLRHILQGARQRHQLLIRTSQHWQHGRGPLIYVESGKGLAGAMEQIPLLAVQRDSNARSVAFSMYGTRIVSGSSDESIQVWDVSTGQQRQVLTSHTDLVNSVSFSKDGTQIVSGSSDDSA